MVQNEARHEGGLGRGVVLWFVWDQCTWAVSCA